MTDAKIPFDSSDGIFFGFVGFALPSALAGG
jgi:hypothetical protein